MDNRLPYEQQQANESRSELIKSLEKFYNLVEPLVCQKWPKVLFEREINSNNSDNSDAFKIAGLSLCYYNILGEFRNNNAISNHPGKKEFFRRLHSSRATARGKAIEHYSTLAGVIGRAFPLPVFEKLLQETMGDHLPPEPLFAEEEALESICQKVDRIASRERLRAYHMSVEPYVRDEYPTSKLNTYIDQEMGDRFTAEQVRRAEENLKQFLASLAQRKEKEAKERPALREEIVLIYIENAHLISHRYSSSELHHYLSEHLGEKVDLEYARRAKEQLHAKLKRLAAQEETRRLYQQYAEFIEPVFDEKMLELYIENVMGDHRLVEEVVEAGARMRQKIAHIYDSSSLKVERDRHEEIEAERVRMRASGMADEMIEEELAARRKRPKV
jgi:hypothetical protein